MRVGARLGALVAALALLGGWPAAALAAVPTSLAIPDIGVQAAIVPVGLTDDGALDAPTDPDTVGWYELGAGLGGSGNVVLDGHVDWGGRLRVFGELRQVGPGTTVMVGDADSDVAQYQVVWSRWYAADATDLDDVFGASATPELTLITCGGEFDAVRHEYLSRLVVRAERV